MKVVQDHAVRCRGRVLECNCEFPVADRRAQWHLLAVDRRKKSECITREGEHLPHLQHHVWKPQSENVTWSSAVSGQNTVTWILVKIGITISCTKYYISAIIRRNIVTFSLPVSEIWHSNFEMKRLMLSQNTVLCILAWHYHHPLYFNINTFSYVF